MPKPKKTRKQYIEEAAYAHTDMALFDTIHELLQGATSDSLGAVSHIQRACRAEIQRCLTRYDAAVAAAEK